jgi:hypothetical protein
MPEGGALITLPIAPEEADVRRLAGYKRFALVEMD